MSARVLIETAVGETRIARLEGERVEDLLVEPVDEPSRLGDVILGRVERVVPGLEAAFVDIGAERAGFLALADAHPTDPRLTDPRPDDVRTDAAAGPRARPGEAVRLHEGEAVRLHEGAAVLVQVTRDALDGKGARLTARIGLASRALVLAPGRPGVRPSRALPAEEAARLAAALEPLLGTEDGAIVRTAAAGASADDLAREVAALRARWAAIRRARANARAPSVLEREAEPAIRYLRDHAPADAAVLFDDAETFARARAWCAERAPALVPRIALHGAAGDLFAAFGAEAALEAALLPEVALPSGGTLLIEPTAALTAIDVNTGGRTEGHAEDAAFATDREAAAEIARQLRLRAIGGLVAIDFVPLRRRDRRDEVVEMLRRAVGADRTPVFVGGATRFGLVELTRERRRRSLRDALTEPCPDCPGGRRASAAAGAFAALRAALRAARATPGGAVELRVSGAVAGELASRRAGARRAVEARLGAVLKVVAEPGRAPERPEALVRVGGHG